MLQAKPYVENINSLYIAERMLKERHSITLHADLCKQLKECRSWLKFKRETNLDFLNSWDCGRQDHYLDSVDNAFQELVILLGAAELKKGTAKRLNKHLTEALGL